jgi:nicotinamide riboside transporter PnuC
MLPIEIIGWVGTFAMLGGSILSIWKNIHCWSLWIIGGILIIIQSYFDWNPNIFVLQLAYVPINAYGLFEWKKSSKEMN